MFKKPINSRLGTKLIRLKTDQIAT